MSTILEASLPADAFALPHLLEGTDGTRVEAEGVVASESTCRLQFVRVRAPDRDTAERALAADPTVDSFERIGDGDGEWRYRITLDGRTELFEELLVREEAAVLDAVGADGRWHLDIYFPTSESATRFHRYCTDNGVDVAIERVVEAGGSDPPATDGLTDLQRETLATALREGYYDDPHRVTTAELGDRFDVSAQAVSTRLRRGHRNLVRASLPVDPDPPDPDDDGSGAD